MTAFFISGEDADRRNQMHEVAAHEINRALSELSEEHLRAVSMMVDGIAMAPDSKGVASYVAGRITQLQQEKFNICAACGVNHDVELLKTDNVNEGDKPPNVDVRRATAETEFTPIGSTLDVSEHEKMLMQVYDIDDLRDGDNHKLVGFICMKCEQQRFSTIQDRLLSEPGVKGCPGCQLKAKWG